MELFASLDFFPQNNWGRTELLLKNLFLIKFGKYILWSLSNKGIFF